jgi:methionine-rich copper-binding protein CopC
MINRRFLIAGILFFMALLALPSASAHSALESSNPARDQVLEAFPSELSLTFNEELISIEGESVNTLTLQGTDGANYDLLAPTVVGAVLSAKAGSAEYPAGEYLLRYRVVSADGHPITGEISFSTQSATTIESDLGVEVVYQEEEQDRYYSNIGFFIVAALFLSLSLYFGVRFRRKSSQ